MLKSQNPFHWPKMLPNFFSDQRDVETLTKGIRAVNYFIHFFLEKISNNIKFVAVLERCKHKKFCEMEYTLQHSTISRM